MCVYLTDTQECKGVLSSLEVPPIFWSQEIESMRTCNNVKETVSEAKVDNMRDNLINWPFQNKQCQNDVTQENKGKESLL